MRIAETGTLIKTQLDIKRDLKSKRKISARTVILIQREKKRWTTMLPRSMLNQIIGSRRFILLVRKKSQVPTISNSIGIRNMKQNNGNSMTHKVINEKLEQAFNKLNSAAKNIIPLGLALQNIETGELRNFYTHENNTFFLKNLNYSVLKQK